MQKLQISLSLDSNPIPPQEISKLLGVKPFTALLQGERNKERDLPRHNIWEVRSDASLETIGEQWEDIVSKFGRNWLDLIEISKKGTVRITIIVDATSHLPSVIIPPKMSEAAYLMNSEIDIDYYDDKD
jgi:hypothetical protein